MYHNNYKKHKKYQYLYLVEKIRGRDLESDMWNITDKRVIFYKSWLNRINKKYKYVSVKFTFFNKVSVVDTLRIL